VAKGRQTTHQRSPAAYEVGHKVRNRHLSEYGIIICVAEKAAGYWYEVTTPNGMHIGWWHETDIDDAPRTSPPDTVRNGQQ